MTPLAGRKILLIGIGFYDYEAAIAAEFRSLGAEVWVENEQAPEMRSRLAPWRRRLIGDDAGALRRHHAMLLDQVRAIGPLDQILVIKGALLGEEFLRALREVQPRAELIAYHWDSMARFPELLRRQRLYDRVLTFDHADVAREPSFVLRPLFFRPELRRQRPGETVLDLCFVGWLHHDRLRQVEMIRQQAAALDLSTFFYLSTGSWTRLKLRARYKGKDVFSRPQAFAQYIERTLSSRAIVDLPHPDQTGLTMRAIESVGAGRKLITTSRDIRRYDFYRPENVQIIDPAAPEIDAAFLASPGNALPTGLVNRYSLRAWSLDVLGITQPGHFIAGSSG